MYSSLWKKTLATVVGAALVLEPLAGSLLPGLEGKAQAAAALAADVVISQVATAGSYNTNTSKYSHDFVELYNPTDHDIRLVNWSLQYADANSSAWKKMPLGAKTQTIKAHGYYLIKMGKGTTNAYNTPLNDADADAYDTSVANMDANPNYDMNKDNGKIALVNTNQLLTKAVPWNDPTEEQSIVDYLAYGSVDTAIAADDIFAQNGSYKKSFLRRGFNPFTQSAAPASTVASVSDPNANPAAGYGNGYKTGKNKDDYILIDSSSFKLITARNSQSPIEPTMVGAIDPADNTVSMSSNSRDIDAADNTLKVKIDERTGAVKNGALTPGVDFSLPNLPNGLGAKAASDPVTNTITFTVYGLATSNVPLDSETSVSISVYSSALSSPLYGPVTITGAKLLGYTSRISAAPVAGMNTVVMSSNTEIDQATFAVQCSNAAHIRTNTDTAPLAAGTDYVVTGLPAGFTVSAVPDTASNQVLFTVANPGQAAKVYDDAPITVVIMKNAVQESGANDSKPITGITLQRARVGLDTSNDRKAYVEQVLKNDNTFFNDPATKAYKYSVEALAHDAFTFFRGTNAVYQADMGKAIFPLPQALKDLSGVKTYTEGDAHFQNVGFFNDSTGTPVFGLNDYDSATVDAFYTDLMRFMTSMYLIRYDQDSANIYQMTDAQRQRSSLQPMYSLIRQQQ